MWFNPVVRGGTSYLDTNPIAIAMKRVQARAPGTWAVFGGEFNRALTMANLPRTIGIPSLGGYQCPPQRALWEKLEPDPAEKMFNQCAYIVLAPGSGPLKIESTIEGTLYLHTPPESKALRDIGVRYFLVLNGPSDFGYFDRKEFRLVEDLGERRIYERFLEHHAQKVRANIG